MERAAVNHKAMNLPIVRGWGPRCHRRGATRADRCGWIAPGPTGRAALQQKLAVPAAFPKGSGVGSDEGEGLLHCSIVDCGIVGSKISVVTSLPAATTHARPARRRH